MNQTWADTVGKGKEVQWPAGVGGQGNDGVAAVVQQQQGSIGYVELSYAIESKLTMASLKNQAGNFITPSLESTSAAAVGAQFPEDLRFSVANSPNADAYPIVGATWILAYDKMTDPAKADGSQGLAHLVAERRHSHRAGPRVRPPARRPEDPGPCQGECDQR